MMMREHQALAEAAEKAAASREEARIRLEAIRKEHDTDAKLLEERMKNTKLLQEEKLKARLKDKRDKKSRKMPTSKGSIRRMSIRDFNADNSSPSIVRKNSVTSIGSNIMMKSATLASL
jgi:hypothetical protein